MLPENTILGTLEYIEVYDLYDTPQFFSCKNQKGEIYLGISPKVDSLVVDNEPLTYVFARVDSNILDLAESTDYLPTNIIWWHSYRKYKVEFLPTENVVTPVSQFELSNLLGINPHDNSIRTIQEH